MPTLHEKLDKVQDTLTETLLMVKEITVKQVADKESIEENKVLSKKNEERIIGNGKPGIKSELASIKVLINSFKEDKKAKQAKIMLLWAQILSTLGAIFVIFVGSNIK